MGVSKSNRRRVVSPASSADAREDQLVSLAFDLAESRLKDGTASAQETTHFLKLGSRRGRLEEARIQNENLLMSAKIDAIKSAERVEELYETALGAMKQYTGQDPEDEEELDGY